MCLVDLRNTSKKRAIKKIYTLAVLLTTVFTVQAQPGTLDTDFCQSGFVNTVVQERTT